MFYPIEGGSYEDIVLEEGSITYRCYLPPVGYGKNVVTGELEYIGIEKRSEKKEEQYWELVTDHSLPQWYIDLREEDDEETKQEINPDYAHPKLEEYRRKQWQHRLCGYWLYINGKPTYLTGLYWFTLRWWNPFGRPVEYWRIHRQVFYHQLWCRENPNSLGQMLAGPRQFGKSMISGVVVYEPTSRTRKAQSTFQSKNDTDSGLLFDKFVVQPWKELPHFFRPIWDTSQGDHPKTSLNFRHTVTKGKKAVNSKGFELLSWIDFYPAGEGALDNTTLLVYVSDEFWKLKKHSILKRHYTVRRGAENQGMFRGFFFYTSTAEDEENGGVEGDAIWEQSKPNMDDINERTESGLHRFFVEAYQIGPMDKYGETDMVKRRIDIEAAIEKASDGNKSMLKRMDPIKESWMRLVSVKDCLYDADILNNRLEYIYGKEKDLWYRGNFIWKDNVPDTTVEFVEDRNGKWILLKAWVPRMGETNRVVKRGDKFYPDNSVMFNMGVDPFSSRKTEDGRFSFGAGYVRHLFSSLEENPLVNGQFICRYHARPDLPTIFYEDMILMAYYFGCHALIENNKNNWEQYFIDRGYENFLVKLPGKENYGIHANDGTHEELWRVTYEFIKKYGEYCSDAMLIQQWLKFDLDNTTKFDLAMAAGWTLVQSSRFVYKQKSKTLTPLTNFIRKYVA